MPSSGPVRHAYQSLTARLQGSQGRPDRSSPRDSPAVSQNPLEWVCSGVVVPLVFCSCARPATSECSVFFLLSFLLRGPVCRGAVSRAGPLGLLRRVSGLVGQCEICGLVRPERERALQVRWGSARGRLAHACVLSATEGRVRGSSASAVQRSGSRLGEENVLQLCGR